MRRKTKYDRDALHFAPFVLFPSPFPEKNFDRVVNIQLVVNELFHKVAHDHEFLRDTLRNTVEVDEFTGRLWGIYQTICDEGGPSQVLILYALFLLIYVLLSLIIGMYNTLYAIFI